MSCRLIGMEIRRFSSSENAVRGFHEPAIQFSLGRLTVFFRNNALPQVLCNRKGSDRMNLGESSE